MLKGDKVLLRPMARDDIPHQHQFNQDKIPSYTRWIAQSRVPRRLSWQAQVQCMSSIVCSRNKSTCVNLAGSPSNTRRAPSHGPNIAPHLP